MSCAKASTLDGSGTMIICGRGNPATERCHYCRAPSDRLCDFVVRYETRGICKVPETCSRPVCAERCSKSPRPGVDHCKHHEQVGQKEATP